jgi:hydrogenase nickel incorporation protein HypA/HybF
MRPRLARPHFSPNYFSFFSICRVADSQKLFGVIEWSRARIRAHAKKWWNAMHESSLAMSILGIVRDQARQAHTGAVRRVDLCVGEYAGVEDSTLAACFEMMALGTVADGAELVIEKIAATGVCDACGAPASRIGRLLRCPHCERSTVTLATGRELYVKSIEVEQPTRRHDHAQCM